MSARARDGSQFSSLLYSRRIERRVCYNERVFVGIREREGFSVKTKAAHARDMCISRY